MKVLVFSDTHGAIQPMQEALKRESDAEVCIHLGDGVDRFFLLREKYPSVVFHGVCGNCDHVFCQPQDLFLHLGGYKLFLTHGDYFHVKQGLALLWEHARQCQAQIALFGHTHKPLYEFKNGIHLFNPGSLGKPLPGTKSHYGIMHLHEGKMPSFDILSL